MLVIGEITMRTIAFAFVAFVLGGCAQDLPARIAHNDWILRNKHLMSNPPDAPAVLEERSLRQIVEYPRKEVAGTVLVDTDNKFLYYVLPKGKAIRYGITLGEEAQAWSGVGNIGRKETGPSWTRTAAVEEGLPFGAGPINRVGARGLYLYSGGKDTLYRICDTDQAEHTGPAMSSGCIRMSNEDLMDLYNRVRVGTFVVVLASAAGYRGL